MQLLHFLSGIFSARIVWLFSILGFSIQVSANSPDSLFVYEKGKDLYLRIQVQHGDNLFLIAKRYKVPPAKLAGLNGLNYQSGLHKGSFIKVPIGKYNYVNINTEVASRPIYYQVKADETLRQVSRKFNVPQSAIQRWNRLTEPSVNLEQIIQTGWVKYDSSQVPFRDTMVQEARQPTKLRDNKPGLIMRRRPVRKKRDSIQVAQDSLKMHSADSLQGKATAYEKLFHDSKRGSQLQERSGAVVFYTLEARVRQGVYYALFDEASVGSIVEITNPSNGKVIYAKIIGSLPDINDYRNTVLGLSNNAVRELGANSRRIFCKIRY